MNTLGNNILAAMQPVQTDDLVRIGRKEDGGYVINGRVLEDSGLVSFGINDDWSFEKAFHLLSKRPVKMFDGSVSIQKFKTDYANAIMEYGSLKYLYALTRIPGSFTRQEKNRKHAQAVNREFQQFLSVPSVEFESCFISNMNDGFSKNIEDIVAELNKNQSWFVKMDIESHEYRVIPCLAENYHCLSGMTIEFHDMDMLTDLFLDQLEMLKKDFVITHIHANNYNPVHPKIGIPACWEISLLNKSYMKNETQLVNGSYPLVGLDFPNESGKPDFEFSF